MNCLAPLLALVTIEFVYLVCFLVGLFYALVAGVLTGLFGGGEGAGHVEAGAGDLDAGGGLDVGEVGADTDLGGHVEVGAGDLDAGGDVDLDAGGQEVAHAGPGAGEAVDQGVVHFSPLSPIVIAMFLTAFGGAGLITSGPLGLKPLVSVPLSVVAGFAVGALTFLLFYKLVQATQASSEAAVAGLVGLEAEVTVPIPRDGTGEIAYVARGTRYTAPARSAEGITLAAHTPVVIRRIAGNTFFVAPKG